LSLANLLAGVSSRRAFQRLKRLLLSPWAGIRGKPAIKPELPECGSCGSPDIVAYDCEELVKDKGKPVVTWNVEREIGRVLELTDGKYFCPKCKLYEMSFKPGTFGFD
jgi:hypothetical protein